MGKFIHNQNSFAMGEVSPEFFARGDLDVSSRGLSRLENMDVLASGGYIAPIWNNTDCHDKQRHNSDSFFHFLFRKLYAGYF